MATCLLPFSSVPRIGAGWSSRPTLVRLWRSRTPKRVIHTPVRARGLPSASLRAGSDRAGVRDLRRRLRPPSRAALRSGFAASQSSKRSFVVRDPFVHRSGTSWPAKAEDGSRARTQPSPLRQGFVGQGALAHRSFSEGGAVLHEEAVLTSPGRLPGRRGQMRFPAGRGGR